MRKFESGTVADFVGPFGGAEGPPLRFVLVGLVAIKNVADDSVPAFLDGAHQHGVVVVEGADVAPQGIPRRVRTQPVQHGGDLLGFLFAKIGILEQNIEADGRCPSVAQVLDHVGVDGTVPGVVVSQFCQGGLVNIHDKDVWVVMAVQGVLVASFFKVVGLACLDLEEHVVEQVF